MQASNCRADFMEHPRDWASGDTRMVVAIEAANSNNGSTARTFRLETDVSEGKVHSWKFCENGNEHEQTDSIRVGLESIFECQVPLSLLDGAQGATFRIRFSVWRDGLPLDALPQEGAMEIHVAPESELNSQPYAKP
jgi:hypothetical protein